MSDVTLNDDRSPIELRETETIEHFVVTASLVLQYPDRDLLAELERFVRIRTPVYARRISSECYVRGDLVQLTADRQVTSIRPGIRNET